MISKENHRKHGNIARSSLGFFGRNEVALLGTSCEETLRIVAIIRGLFKDADIAFADMDHAESIENIEGTHLQKRGTHFQVALNGFSNQYEQRILLSQSDMILVNGNHFAAQSQIVVCNPKKEKSLRKRSEQLTNVKALLLEEGQSEVPEYVRELVPNYSDLPILNLSELTLIRDFFQKEFLQPLPLKALILAGGRSMRMGEDKAAIKHHSKEQFLHLREMLNHLFIESYVSCRLDQANFYHEKGCNVITDAVTNLGPLGGIVSAFMQFPDSPWLVIACDIPLLDESVLSELLQARNQYKTATCFKSPFDGLPEPLISIWEPKSYIRIMEYIAQGYDCPRKVLINTESMIVECTQPEKLMNVNTPSDLLRLIK